MSQRRSGRRGWEQPRTPPWAYAVIGVLLTLAVVLAIVIVMLLGSGPGDLAAASATPTGVPTAMAPASEPGASPTAEVTPEPTPKVTAPPTPSPTLEVSPGTTPSATPAATPAATPGAGGSPAPSTKPTLVSMTVIHKADCNADNGTGQIGMVSINWTTTGATGVRISIDPPSAAEAYGYGYADYGPTGPAIVPFACGATLQDSGGYYHLYVVTTLHTSGYYQYRYQKVYQSP